MLCGLHNNLKTIWLLLLIIILTLLCYYNKFHHTSNLHNNSPLRRQIIYKDETFEKKS